MSEFNVEHMMDNLERNERPDYDEKADEVIENLRADHISKFLNVYCAIKLSPTRRFFDKNKKLEEKLRKLAKETFDESEFYYLGSLEIILKSNHEFYDQFSKPTNRPSELKPIYQAYIDGEIILPSQEELSIAIKEDYSRMLIIPGQVDDVFILAELERKLRTIDATYGQNLLIDKNDKLISDDRPKSYYTIGLENGLSSSNNDYKFPPSTSPDKYKKIIDMNQDVIVNGERNTDMAEVRGLTLKEYIIMQLFHIKVAQDNKLISRDINLLDKTIDKRAVLLGSRIINEGRHLGYLSAFFSNDRTLWIDTDRVLDREYHPWLSIGFDGSGFDGGANE